MSQKGQPEKTNDARQAAFLVILRENKKLTNFNRTIFCIMHILYALKSKLYLVIFPTGASVSMKSWTRLMSFFFSANSEEKL